MAGGPCGRFLHVCYSCAASAPLAALYAEAFALREVMATPLEPSDGALLGLAGQIVSDAVFVYDRRGPRVSPAIEVQGWAEPPVTGTPVDDAARAGIQALGFAVAELDPALDRLTGLGFALVASAITNAFAEAPSAVLRDPHGALVDVVEDRTLLPGAPRFRHLRVGASDLDASLRFYAGLGFDVVEPPVALSGPGALGWPDDAEGRVARVRLPEEGFEVVLLHGVRPATYGAHPEVANHAGWYRAALRVDDTRAAYERMTAAGWAFSRPPQLVELHGTPVPDMWICFLDDPDGVPYEFVQRPRDAFRPE